MQMVTFLSYRSFDNIYQMVMGIIEIIISIRISIPQHWRANIVHWQ